jgi:peptidoglycan/xylan/chitin deacetylase (PgdA/CDA1 family)
MGSVKEQAMLEDSTSRATVILSVHFDAMSLWLGWGVPPTSSRLLSRGEFSGRVGAPRVLDILKRYNVKASWFIPGHSAETFPEVAARVAEEGHEIGNHGYAHENLEGLSLEDIRRVIQKGNDALQRVTGQLPRGFCAPAGEFDGRLLELLLEEGFTYDHSRMDGEFTVYWARGFDEIRLDGPPVWGPRLDLVEVPISWLMQDFRYYEFNYGTPLLVGSSTPSQVEEIWTTQFDYMWERVPGGVMALVVHPDAVGWGARSAVLERFIEHVLSKDGARIATCETIANEFRASQAAVTV